MELNSGAFVVGQWLGTTATGMLIKNAEGSQELPIDQVVALRLAFPRQLSSKPSMQVGLVDGTWINAESVAIEDALVNVQPRRQNPITIPIKQVRSIRIRAASVGTDPQWLGLAEKESRSDVMVIRRGNDQLDPIEGVVLGMDAKNVFFQIDGDRIEAPRERLEGLLLGTTAAASSSAAVTMIDIHGSQFLVSPRNMTASADAIEFQLPGQVQHVLPIDQIHQIRWASGRMMLAAQPAAASQMAAYLETKLPTALLNDWFAPVADGEDLVAVANSKIDFRVEPGFQTLSGSVSRDPAVDNGGATIVRVSVDDEVKWEQTLTDATTKGFQISVAGARRVGLQVMASEDGDVGDQVRFLKPRLMK